MGIVLEDYVEARYQGMVSIRGPAGALPVILLKDSKERTMAVPLGSLESDLIRRTLSGNAEGPQPHRILIACLSKLDAGFAEVRIHYSEEFDLPTCLVLRPAAGREIEVAVPCSDGIACAQLAQVPIYISEKLMAAVGARGFESSGTGSREPEDFTSYCL